MSEKIWNVSVYDEDDKFVKTYYFDSCAEAQKFANELLCRNPTYSLRVGFEKV